MCCLVAPPCVLVKGVGSTLSELGELTWASVCVSHLLVLQERGLLPFGEFFLLLSWD